MSTVRPPVLSAPVFLTCRQPLSSKPDRNRPERAEKINSMCTVFAESEVISLTSRGAARGEVALGIHKAIVSRSVALLKRVCTLREVFFAIGCRYSGRKKGNSRIVEIPSDKKTCMRFTQTTLWVLTLLFAAPFLIATLPALALGANIRISGEVRKSLSLSSDDLKRMPSFHINNVTLDPRITSGIAVSPGKEPGGVRPEPVAAQGGQSGPNPAHRLVPDAGRECPGSSGTPAAVKPTWPALWDRNWSVMGIGFILATAIFSSRNSCGPNRS